MKRIALITTLLSIAFTATTTHANPFQKDNVDKSIEKGVKFLMSMQHDRGDRQGAIRAEGHHQNMTAMTALSVMTLAAVGHQPADPTPQGRTMRNAINYVLREGHQDHWGYYGNDGSRMYGHGIITLMLAEMLGMGVDDKTDLLLKKRVEKAVRLILLSQRVSKGWNNRGGWRYTPDANDSDLSITVWQVLALRSAKNAGVDVPKESIDAAVGYLERCYDRSREGFSYTANGGAGYAMPAAGMLSMQLCGEYDSDEVKGAADTLYHTELDYNHHWFFYGTYYYAQGMYQAGGKFAKRARRQVESVMLRHQNQDGSWSSGGGGHERSVGRVYTTCMAMLSLSVKYHYLPIYQR